jgi:hypothetical protein
MIIQKAKKSQDHKKESKRSTRNPKKGGPNIIPKLAIKKETPIPKPADSFSDRSPARVIQIAFHPIPVTPKRAERK